ncbi:MAG: hypothetical protein HY654_00915 [Acidobacteria bacterium]|nr:hypothetical protein [Acidobacteriota bacterium]
MTIFELLILLVLVVLTIAVLSAGRELRQRREDAIALELLRVFGPLRETVQQQPKELLAWYPLGRAIRRLWPDACRRLDESTGTTFPFTREHVDAAHARWTASWLAWERNHDAEFKLKAAQLERALIAEERQAGTFDHERGTLSAIGRARIEAIEREKLERYQDRYEEYVRVAKAIAALEPPPSREPPQRGSP